MIWWIRILWLGIRGFIRKEGEGIFFCFLIKGVIYCKESVFYYVNEDGVF